MSPGARKHKYDKDGLPVLSVLESTSLIWIVIRMPFVLLWTVLASKFKKNAKPTNRLLVETSSRYILGKTSIEQLQKISGTSGKAYETWAKAAKKTPVVEHLEDGTEVFWVGEKGAEYVLAYCHGGGFVGPLCDFQCKFIEQLCAEFTKKSGYTLSCAILNYSVLPTPFPAQVTQLHGLLRSILRSHSPSRIFLAGDSAGANILTQLFLSTLSPFSLLPPALALASPFAGAVLMSPWCTLNPTGRSVTENAHTDFLLPDVLNTWGTAYRASVPPALLDYADLSAVPPGSYDFLSTVTSRVYITVGTDEILRDDILVLAETLKGAHADVQVAVQQGGVHVDMVFDVAAKSKVLSEETVKLVRWMVEGAGAGEKRKD